MTRVRMDPVQIEPRPCALKRITAGGELPRRREVESIGLSHAGSALSGGRVRSVRLAGHKPLP